MSLNTAEEASAARLRMLDSILDALEKCGQYGLDDYGGGSNAVDGVNALGREIASLRDQLCARSATAAQRLEEMHAAVGELAQAQAQLATATAKANAYAACLGTLRGLAGLEPENISHEHVERYSHELAPHPDTLLLDGAEAKMRKGSKTQIGIDAHGVEVADGPDAAGEYTYEYFYTDKQPCASLHAEHTALASHLLSMDGIPDRQQGEGTCAYVVRLVAEQRTQLAEAKCTKCGLVSCTLDKHASLRQDLADWEAELATATAKVEELKNEPRMGLATTGELLDELSARFEMHAIGGLAYRTVDGEAFADDFAERERERARAMQGVK